MAGAGRPERREGEARRQGRVLGVRKSCGWGWLRSCDSAVQEGGLGAEGQGGAHVGGVQGAVLAGEVGDRAGYSADAVQASACEAAGAEGAFHEALGGAVEGGYVVQAPGWELGIHGGAAARGPGAGCGYAGCYRGGRLGAFGGEEVVRFGASYLSSE